MQALISTTIERNYGVVEQMGDRLAVIEEEVLEKLPKESVATLQKANIAGRVHAIKRELYGQPGSLLCYFYHHFPRLF